MSLLLLQTVVKYAGTGLKPAPTTNGHAAKSQYFMVLPDTNFNPKNSVKNANLNDFFVTLQLYFVRNATLLMTDCAGFSRDRAMSTPVQTRCEYKVLEDGIHEVIVYDFSRAGADEFLKVLEQIRLDLGAEDVSSVIIDSSRGTLPINYTFTRVRQMGVRTWRDGSKIAVLAQSGVMIGMFSHLLRMLPRLNLRLFTQDKRQAALDWLRQK
jgi:hypothetical protein